MYLGINIKINCITSDPPQIKATEQQGQNFGQGNYTYMTRFGALPY